MNCTSYFDCDLYKLLEEGAKFMDLCKSINPLFTFLTNLDKWKFISSTQDKSLLHHYYKYAAAAFEH